MPSKCQNILRNICGKNPLNGNNLCYLGVCTCVYVGACAYVCECTFSLPLKCEDSLSVTVLCQYLCMCLSVNIPQCTLKLSEATERQCARNIPSAHSLVHIYHSKSFCQKSMSTQLRIIVKTKQLMTGKRSYQRELYIDFTDESEYSYCCFLRGGQLAGKHLTLWLVEGHT